MTGPDIIFRYFPELTASQKEQVAQLGPLYQEWNARVNVISRKDIDNLYLRHVLHSLAIARVVSFKPGTFVLDVGTGGGFPGIPLAIVFPSARFTLVDSIGKKVRVVEEVAGALGLTNVIARRERAADVTGSFDFAVSRAVATVAELRQWIKGKVHRKSAHDIANGMLVFKGGAIAAEISDVRNAKVFDLDTFFPEEFFASKKIVHLPA